LNLESCLFKKETPILTRADFEELRSITKATSLVTSILQAFCMLLQIKPKRIPSPNGSITNDYFKAFQTFMKPQKNFHQLLQRDFNLYAVPQESLFIVNQFLIILLTKESKLETLAGTVPGSVFNLLLWLLAAISYCKILNPMIFMTKEYFIQRVNEQEMWVVQHLVDLVEDWRFCKRLEMKKRCEVAREAARRYEAHT